jgi:hypothetical protein
MALGAKRSRRITVNGAVYRWKVRHRPTYSQANGWTPLTFALQKDAAQGRVLLVSLPAPHPGGMLELVRLRLMCDAEDLAPMRESAGGEARKVPA